jgi:hypothetical protein
MKPVKRQYLVAYKDFLVTKDRENIDNCVARLWAWVRKWWDEIDVCNVETLYGEALDNGRVKERGLRVWYRAPDMAAPEPELSIPEKIQMHLKNPRLIRESYLSARLNIRTRFWDIRWKIRDVFSKNTDKS